VVLAVLHLLEGILMPNRMKLKSQEARRRPTDAELAQEIERAYREVQRHPAGSAARGLAAREYVRLRMLQVQRDALQ
jgi:hypothetical protein